MFDASGNSIGDDFLVNTNTDSSQRVQAITALNDGGFLVVWEDRSGIGGDDDNTGIKGQRFDASGNRVSTPLADGEGGDGDGDGDGDGNGDGEGSNDGPQLTR